MNAYTLYHGNCPDGFGAAWSVWKALGSQAEYIPVQHDQPLPKLKPGSKVYLVDFSYPQAVLMQLADVMQQVVVLDHHKSAQQALAGLPSLEAVERGDSNIGARFEMEKSGAVLAWEFFHPKQPLPALLQYVQDKDLWRFSLPHSRAVSAALSSHPFDFEVWETLNIDQLQQEGQVLVRLLDRYVERLVERAYWRRLGDYEIPVVNTPLLGSNVGNQLCVRFPEAPFAACYSDPSEGQRHWELRSKGAFDVSEVAVQFGGGGHRNAAGFTESL